ncbi:MAG TPA: O-methyltransferase [Polyangia bacterium]|jgi:catechol O-methyltransferase
MQTSTPGEAAPTSGWKKKLPFLRWSLLRMALTAKRQLLVHWQAGDGREERLARYVTVNARRGDLADAIRAIDRFAYDKSFLINVGDEKGEILDGAVRRARPRRILELGTYCGYSALRMARAAPDARIVSIELNPANADIARRIFDHAGVGARITVIVGALGDGGATRAALRDRHGFGAGSVDFVFVDHAKDAYLPDLQRIEDEGWLHPGSVVVADNVTFPGAPAYHAYMKLNEGRSWRSTEHRTHAEYQTLIRDLVLESVRLI